jgi:hypothetical protein
MKPGQVFMKTWWVKNKRSVPWKDRQLELQGPVPRPGLITSPRYIPIAEREPGEVAMISSPLKAPTYDCASIAYFKIVAAEGQLCFPDNDMLGLDVLVLVRGQMSDEPSEIEIEPVKDLQALQG